MKKYLIMKCQDTRDYLTNEEESDTPIIMCDDWEKWYKENINKINYVFEVWELKEDKFTCIKRKYDILEEGMALYCWENKAHKYKKRPKIIYKYPNLTLEDEIPKSCLEYYSKGKNFENLEFGKAFFIGNTYYCYTEYEDNIFYCE